MEMRSERRVAACMLLLVAAIPLLVALLPERGLVAAIPTAAILIAAAIVLAPMPERIRATVTPAVWLVSAGVLTVYTGWFAPMGGAGWLMFVPLGLALLTDRAWVSLGGFGVVATAMAFVPDQPSLAELGGFSYAGGLDLLGPASVGVWLGWQAWKGVASRTRGQACQQQLRTSAAMDDAIARDCQRLETIARTVADPSLRGPVKGLGLGANALALAARIDSNRVLLGWIDGPPLATLTLGWALLAAARSGLSTPRELLRLARNHFDEVVPPTSIRWLGIWDRRSTYVEAAPIPSGAYNRCRVSSRGPNGNGGNTIDTIATIESLIDLPECDGQEPGAPPPAAWWIAATAIAGIAFVAAAIPGPLTVVGLVALLACSSQWLQESSRRRGDKTLAEGAAWLTDRIEVHDDLRFQVAKLHGGLLPYRIEVGESRATAHRLRGEVLDGAFADMVVDDRGVGHIVAGEVAGRGIAARFLGLAAQVIARVRLSQVSRHSPSVAADILRRLRVLGETLKFPVRMRLGEITLHPDGRVVGTGVVRRVVEVHEHDAAVLGPASASDLVTITSDTRITEQSRLYITPSAALPGPDDEAPALRVSEATDRVVEMVTSGKWHPSHGSLASLFSLVFDGRNAPAHGTLIELASVSHDDEEDEAQDPLALPSIGAVAG